MPDRNAVSLSELVIEEPLHRGRRALVHQARERASGRAFVVKRAASDAHAADLAHEWQLGSSISSPHVVGYLAFEEGAVVLEHAGRSLASRLADGRPSLGEALNIALGIARGLQAVHGAGIIHGDVHPGNVHEDDSGQVRLGDFSRAARAHELMAPPIRPAERLAALPYLSPEQSGRIHRPVDHRSDYYSLGALLFELLTGKPPFAAADPLETIHAHTATRPELVHRIAPAVPLPISQLVDKLLAKDADQRYQSGFGLISDLERCRALLEPGATRSELELGTDDAPERFRLPLAIYGRDRERAEVWAALERASAGAPELFLVGGAAGSGKTALVNELSERVAQARGLFVSGRFDELGRSTAYGGLRQVLGAIARTLLAASESGLEAWRRRFGAVLGGNAQVVLDLAPELEAVLGKPRALPELGPAESKARFERTLRAFFHVLGEEAPFVVFLDDLHHADPASRDLLPQIVSGSGVRLLLIGAYRTESAGSEHPLWTTVEAIRAAGTSVGRLALQALSSNGLEALVRDTVGTQCARGDIAALAKLLYDKTGGNPFFARLLLSRLHEGGLIARDASGRWSWDLEKVRAQKITDNVVDLVVARAAELAPEALFALRLGACFGSRFQIASVAHALGVDAEAAAALLGAAVGAGLLQPSAEGGRGGLEFVHERVRQSIHEAMSKAERRTGHFAAARTLLAEVEAGAGHSVFSIVAQYNQALPLLSDPAERGKVAALNLSAGGAAMASGAYAAARDYYSAGVALLGEDGWRRDQRTTFALHLGLVECESLAGNESAFQRLAALAETHAADETQHAKLAVVRLTKLASGGAYRDALVSGIAALGRIGLALPALDDTAAIGEAFDATLARHAARWGTRPIDEHADLPASREDRHVLTSAILSALIDCALIGAPHYLGLLTASMVEYFVEHGNTPSAAMGYASHATVLANLERFEEAYAYGRMALRLHEIAPEPSVTSKLYNMFGAFVQQFKRPFGERLPVFREGMRAGLESGDLLFTCYNTVNHTRGELFAGRNLGDFLRDRPELESKLKALRIQAMGDFAQMFYGFAANLSGESGSAESLDSAGFTEIGYYATYGAVPVLASHLHVYRMRAHYLHGRYAQARALIPEVAVGSIGGQVEWEHFHFFAALSLLAGTDEITDPDLIARSTAFVERVAEACPENFAPHAAMLRGERARRAGDLLAATDAFDRALESALEQDLLHEAALAAELSARAWSAAGRPLLARPYADAAIAHYRAWGATALVRRLEHEYGAAARARGKHSDAPSDLDVLNLVRAASALTSEMDLNTLIEQLMRTVLQIGGAERAVLLLQEDDKLRVAGQCSGERAELVDRIPVGEFGLLAEPVVQLAARTRKAVATRNARHELAGCDYAVETGQKSLFAAPLLKQRQLIGVLYLENKLVSGAFTAERTQALELVAGQLAVAIDNARLYGVVLEHTSELEARVAERTDQLRAILDNVTFGFLVLDPSLRVQPGYTRSCHALLDREQIAGAHFAELVGLGTEDQSAYELAAEQVFDDLLPEALALAQLPWRFVLAHGVILKAEAKLIRHEDGRSRALLVSLSDTRALESVQRENESNRMLLRILRDKDAFRSYLVDTRQRLSRARAALAEQEVVRRELHTIKGHSAMHGLDPIVAEIHRIEQESELTAGDVDRVEAAVRDFLRDNHWALGMSFEDARREVAVDEAWLEQLGELIRDVPPPARQDLEELHRRASLCSARALLGPVDKLVENLALRLGKNVEFSLRGGDVLVEPPLVEDVFRQLSHLLRNAIDHGIEAPGERGDKPEVAKLTLAVEDRRDEYAIIVEDDGRGIDRSALLAKAVERQIVDPDRATRLPDEELLGFIFRDGLSTAERVTDVSGRGVGMAAIKSAVSGHGGQIGVRSVSGRGTTFELLIPRRPIARSGGDPGSRHSGRVA